jgi:hypothetical protein
MEPAESSQPLARSKSFLERERSLRILEPLLGFTRRFYSSTRDLPVVGRFVQFSVQIADVAVQRLTPWENCSDLDDQIGIWVPYIDSHVLTPQLRLALPLYSRAHDAVRSLVEPYLEDYSVCIGWVSWLWATVVAIAKPFLYAAVAVWQFFWQLYAGWIWCLWAYIWQRVEPWVRECDTKLAGLLDGASAHQIFEVLQASGSKAAEFAMDHAQEAQELVVAGVTALEEAARKSTDGGVQSLAE